MSYISEGSFDFALKLYQILSNNEENLVLSPFSLTCALSMTLLGTQDSSRSQLSKALFGKEIAANEFESMVQHLESLIDKCLKTNSRVLRNANFIYIHSKYPVLTDFRQTLEKNFSAKSRELDFISAQSDSVNTINNDICEATNGKIPKFIDSIDSMTRIILVNAIYFKGLWKSQFASHNTSVQEFRTGSGQQVQVDMMFQETKFPFAYSQQLQCKAVQLGYETSNISMIVLLPDQNSSLKELQSKLNSQSLNDLLNNLSDVKVSLSLPKFKLESSLHLIPPLVELGIKDIFDRTANFSGLTKDPAGLYVSDVIQKAVIEVNEEGTEAAAATGIMISLMCLEITEEFKADRPFMFLLVTKYEQNKNLILFMGAVNNPKL